jgi:tripartite-type tricarboxylate transporter receptor subunit TctC
VQSWQGVFAPAGTPQAIVDKLAENIAAVLRMPDVRQRMAQIGMEIDYKGPADFAQYQAREIARWGKLLTAAGIKPE